MPLFSKVLVFAARVTLASFLIYPSYPSYADTEGSLSGSLTHPDGTAAEGVELVLKSERGSSQQMPERKTKTDKAGHYSFFAIPLGTYELSGQESESFAPVQKTVDISSGGNALNLELELTSSVPAKESKESKESKEMLLEVRARKRALHTNAVSSSELRREEIEKLPQGMEISLPKLIATTTPGAIQGPFGQIYFRGNHANIQYQIDGVQLPDSPSNTFGQSISPRNIDRMEVITGGIPAEYGQRLSAVLNIVTKRGPEKPGGEVELNYGSYNAFTPHLLLGGSNEAGNLHYFLSANYNQTDRGLDTPQPVSETDQTQGGTESIHNKASGNSEFAKVDWQASNQDKVSFILSHSQGNFQIPTYPSSFLPTSNFFKTGFKDSFQNQNLTAPTYNYVPTDTDNSQAETNAYGQVVWRHTFSDRMRFQLAPYYRYSLIAVKNDPVNDLAAKSLIAGATPSSFAQNRHVNNLGLKADFHFRPSDAHLMKVGFQLQASRSDGWLSIQSDPAVAPFSDSSPTNGYFQSVYFQDDFTLSKSLILNAGLRFDAAQFSFGSGIATADQLLQPRIGLNYLISDKTKIHGFYGKLFQPAAVESLRYQYDAGNVSALVPHDLKAEKDDFFEVGISHEVLPKQVALLNAYYKIGKDILDDHQLLNTSIAQPYNFASGYAYGVEFSLKGQITEDWSEYLNYSYGMAQGLESSGGIGIASGSTEYQVLDHVQMHTANAGLTYAKNSYWWTLQAMLGSGLRTGPNNSIGLPFHFSMDTTVGYLFKKDMGLLSELKVSADILNIFNNVYPITIANGFNGSHYAAGRQFFVRVSKKF